MKRLKRTESICINDTDFEDVANLEAGASGQQGASSLNINTTGDVREMDEMDVADTTESVNEGPTEQSMPWPYLNEEFEFAKKICVLLCHIHRLKTKRGS